MLRSTSRLLSATKQAFLRRTMATSTSPAPLIVSPQQLSEMAQADPSVRILDASWFMPNSPRNGKTEYLSKRIPGAQFLDLDAVASSHELGLKHMMPSGSVFADACESFGISPTSSVVLYDTHGVFSSPRALFTFRSFGHTKSSILNGGLPLWEHSGLAIESSKPVERERATYPPPQLNTATIRDYDQMVANSALQDGAEIVLDARSRGRFLGTDPEPRPGLSSGHMPNSYSLPFNVFLATQTTPAGASFTVMRPAQEIRQALIDAVGEQAVEAIIKGEASVATTCGSGMTAAVLWLGLKLVNAQKVALYDESWTGYAMRATSKIEKSV